MVFGLCRPIQPARTRVGTHVGRVRAANIIETQYTTSPFQRINERRRCLHARGQEKMLCSRERSRKRPLLFPYIGAGGRNFVATPLCPLCCMAKPGSKAGSGPAGPRASPSDDPEAEELRELEQRAQELQQQVDRALKEFDGVHRANVQLRERVRAREADQREVLKNLERKVQRNQQYIAALEAQRKALEEERERIESSIREELDVHLERVQRAQGRVKELEEDWTHKAELLERAGQVLAHNQKLQQEVADLEAQVKHIEELIDLRQRQENVLATVMRPAEEGVEGTAGGETAAAAPKYDLGVLPLLVEAPRQFPSVAGVHHECCVTLYHLLLDAPDRAYDAMALGGLDVAVNALTAFGTELPTRHVACRLAAQLAGTYAAARARPVQTLCMQLMRAPAQSLAPLHCPPQSR